MTNAPIIRIPVDNSSFEAFYKLFNQYAAKLEEMPQEWQQLNEAMGGAGDALAKGAMTAQQTLALAAASTTSIVEAIALAAKGQDVFTKSTKGSATAMGALGDKVKDVVAGVLELNRSVFKFGGIAGTLTGIGGAVGIADLAGTAMTSQRNAAGLGLSVGQMRAFQTGLGPLVGSNVLQGAAGAQVDPSKYGLLAALGINGAQAANEDAGTLATQEINAVRSAWKRNPSLLTAQSQAALQLGFTVSDIRNVAGADASTLSSDERMARNAAGLGFSAATANSWTKLAQTLNRAEFTVQSALINGLEPLTPIFIQLSKATSDALAAFLTSKTLKTDLTEFSSWLESPKFKQDVTDFITGFDVLASKIKGWLQALGIWPTNNPPPPGPKPSPSPPGWKYPGFSLPSNPDGAVSPASARFKIGSYGLDFSAVEKQNNLPPGTLAALAKVESGMDPNAVSPKGAQGMFQLLPSTASSLHVDPFDVGQSSYAAGWLIGSAYKHYGDLKKAIAAYNWGAGSLDKDIAKHGADWLRYAPQETQNEISKVIKDMNPTAHHTAPPQMIDTAGALANLRNNTNDKTAALLKRLIQQGIVKPAHITISNSTSAKVAVSANAAAHG